MIYKVGVCGASGKMGLEICSLLANRFTYREDQLELADAVSLTQKIKSIEGVPVRGFKDAPFEQPHVWIDFSHPDATHLLLRSIHTPLVIGTTGLSPALLEDIKTYSEKYAVLVSPNMSPGLNLFLEMLRKVPVPKEFGFDVLLSETHHTKKLDSPSGTAKLLLQTLRSTGQGEVGLQVARVGGVRGVHKVSFTSQDEELVLEHRVFNREVFARGALMAAHFVLNAKPGMYSMADLWKTFEVKE